MEVVVIPDEDEEISDVSDDETEVVETSDDCKMLGFLVQLIVDMFDSLSLYIVDVIFWVVVSDMWLQCQYFSVELCMCFM